MDANEGAGLDGDGAALEGRTSGTTARPPQSNRRRAAGVALLVVGLVPAVFGELILISAVPQLPYEGPEADWYGAWGLISVALGGALLAAGLVCIVAGARLAIGSQVEDRRRAWAPIAGSAVIVTMAVGALAAWLMNASAPPSGDPGTVTVTLGARTAAYPDAYCDALGGSLYITSEFPDTDGVDLEIPPNGGTPRLSGAVAGVRWHATESQQVTLDWDWSGSFSGTDEVSGLEVAGTFVCR